MIFYSPYVSYQVLVRSEEKRIHQTPAGTIVETVPALTVEFGEHGGTFQYQNPLTGGLEEGAYIRGNYLDTDVAAERNGWSEEEKALVEAALLKLCRERPDEIRIYEKPAPEKPWPTYDDTDPSTIVQVAVSTNLIREVIAYEEATLRREKILRPLEKHLETLAVEEALLEAKPV
jgi:hypothetical protein